MYVNLYNDDEITLKKLLYLDSDGGGWWVECAKIRVQDHERLFFFVYIIVEVSSNGKETVEDLIDLSWSLFCWTFGKLFLSSWLRYAISRQFILYCRTVFELYRFCIGMIVRKKYFGNPIWTIFDCSKIE